jgi:hypothetical protein
MNARPLGTLLNAARVGARNFRTRLCRNLDIGNPRSVPNCDCVNQRIANSRAKVRMNHGNAC